jgi:hypothetical protein
MEMNIHNQCPDFKLTDRGYFSTGADWNEKPCLEVDTDSMKSVGLITFLSTFGGILTYKLERKHIKSVNLSESTHILLFVAWKSEGYKKFCVFVHLIEYGKWFYRREILLEEYYQRYASQFSTYTGPIKDTWLTCDGTVLMTELELDFTLRDGVLNMAISKGVNNDHTKRAEWINPKM